MSFFYDQLEEFLKEYEVDIPISDVEAFVKYTDYNKVYNKLEIAKFQNLDANPFPCFPKKFPIVSKPIINLFGMGLNAFKISSKKKFIDHLPTNNFWCEFLEGDHLGWDFVIRNGKIIYYVCFYGKKLNFGTFKYWSQIESPKILDNIQKIIDHYFEGYTGIVNMETLGHYVIEVHLRMGDIKTCDLSISKLALLNYTDNDDLIKNQLSLINQKNINLIHLVPVWEKVEDSKKIQRKINLVRKKIEPELQDDDKIIDFFYPSTVNPEEFQRWYLLFVNDLKYGIRLSNKYSKTIKKIDL